MLVKRILTAIILIPITLGLLFYLPPMGFGLLTAAITLIAAWEWTNLIEIKSVMGKIAYVVIIDLFLFAALFVPILFILALAFFWWLCALAIVIAYPVGYVYWAKSKMIRGVMGILVLIPTWTALNLIRDQHDGMYALLFLFVLIWGADTAAYFVGKKWGKTKLAPKVSPGKTWQGLAGALIYAIVFASILQWYCEIPLQLCRWGVLLSVIVVVFSIVGDLFESVLKRVAGLKDSSQLLPGHGGLLDRIDSLTAAAPIFALSAIFLGIYLE